MVTGICVGVGVVVGGVGAREVVGVVGSDWPLHCRN